MNNKINHNGYVLNKTELTEQQLKKIKNDLTVAPKTFGEKQPPLKSYFKNYSENEKKICVPRYYGIENFGQPKINKLNTKELKTYNMKYLGKMRDNQKIITDKILTGLNDKNIRGGLLIAGCGIGKTNMALYIMCKIKVKTLWIVHKTFLKNQIIERMTQFTNVKETDVGIIQGSKLNVEPHVVIGTVQSIAQKDYDLNIFKDFDLVIIDEVHHMAAKNFSSALQKISPRYTLGITAENSRNDGLFNILNWYLGPILHYEPQKKVEQVIVKRLLYNSNDKEKFKIIYPKRHWGRKEPLLPTMITNLTEIEGRNNIILDILEYLFINNRKILFLSGRIEHLKKLKIKIIERNVKYEEECGFYLGGMKESELEKSSNKKIIFATYEMAQEGLDIPTLNSIILSTPKTKINQAVFRILRKETYEIQPLIIDIIDILGSFEKQGIKRKQFYFEQGFNVCEKSLNDKYNTNELYDFLDNNYNFVNRIEKNKYDINKTFIFDDSD